MNKYFFHNLGKDDWFNYQGINNFLYAIVNSSESVTVMSCVSDFE